MGKAGGHDRRAGGYVDLTNRSADAIEDVQAELCRRIRKALRFEDAPGERLVPQREIIPIV
jgi:hypothetical protein